MLSTRSISSIPDPDVQALMDLEQQIDLIEGQIASLRKTAKKLSKLEEELANTNFLLESSIGSKADQKALRQTKKTIRQRRVTLWQKLEALPALEEERKGLTLDLEILRRRAGLLL